MTEEELDAAAHELMQARSPGPSGPRPQFYEQPGGYSMHEMQDYNKYPPTAPSSQPHTPKRGGAGPAGGGPGAVYDPDNDDMVYVTTL